MSFKGNREQIAGMIAAMAGALYGNEPWGNGSIMAMYGNEKSPLAVQSKTGAEKNVQFILPQDTEKCNMEATT